MVLRLNSPSSIARRSVHATTSVSSASRASSVAQLASSCRVVSASLGSTRAMSTRSRWNSPCFALICRHARYAPHDGVASGWLLDRVSALASQEPIAFQAAETRLVDVDRTFIAVRKSVIVLPSRVSKRDKYPQAPKNVHVPGREIVQGDDSVVAATRVFPRPCEEGPRYLVAWSICPQVDEFKHLHASPACIGEDRKAAQRAPRVATQQRLSGVRVGKAHPVDVSGASDRRICEKTAGSVPQMVELLVCTLQHATVARRAAEPIPQR